MAGQLPSPEEADSGYRALPHNIEAEQGLLGALLVNNDAIDKIIQIRPSHFFDPVHGRIFESITKKIADSEVASPVTLKTHFEHDEGLIQLGGTAYLAKLVSNATTIINIHQYGKVIIDLSHRRELIKIGEDMVNTAFESDLDESPQTQIDDAVTNLLDIRGEDSKNSIFTAGQAARMATNAAIDIMEGKTSSGLKTGFSSLDKAIYGLKPETLTILAGRPGMGKSSFALALAQGVVRNGHRGIFFTLEMTSEEMATRGLSSLTKIPYAKLFRGGFNEEEAGRLIDAQKKYGQLYKDLIFAEIPNLSLAQVSIYVKKYKPDFIVIDQLSWMGDCSTNAETSIHVQYTILTNGLRRVAKEAKIPVLLLAQLSRATEMREDKIPTLTDLKNSGSLEENADNVLMLHRPAHYAKDAASRNELRNELRLIIAKGRNSPFGGISMKCEIEVCRFWEEER